MDDDELMTAAEFAVRRHLLGLTLDEMADVLGVHPQTTRGWEAGKQGYRIPAGVTAELAALDREHAALAHDMSTDGRPVAIVRDKAAGLARPRGWYVAAAARALLEEPDLAVEWV